MMETPPDEECPAAQKKKPQPLNDCIVIIRREDGQALATKKRSHLCKVADGGC